MSLVFEAFQTEISYFPKEVQQDLQTILKHGGVLRSRQVESVLKATGMDIAGLMIKLLPLAASYAAVPISNFCVGAVAAGISAGEKHPSLYLGANMEFAQEDISLSIHAEQAATMNAWQHDEKGLSMLAVSKTPCGLCRQFLNELATAQTLSILIPGSNIASNITNVPLRELLPHAFGPKDLGAKGGLMRPVSRHNKLRLASKSDDQLSQKALEAAGASYAPYTRGYAGCAIQTEAGVTYLGRYAENAAYNPSVSAMQGALVTMNMSSANTEQPKSIEKVVLVELPSQTSQLPVTRRLLKVVAPNANFSYYQAKL